MARVTLPDGRKASIDIPSWMGEEEAKTMVAELYAEGAFDTPNADPTQPGYSPELARQEQRGEMSGLDKFLTGVGGGMAGLARGLSPSGDTRTPVERQAYNALRDESTSAMVGDVLGTAAPLLATAPLGGSGLTAGATQIIPRATSFVTRLGLGGILGAGEGAAITRGDGGDAGEILVGAGVGGVLGSAGEAVAPYAGRLVNQTLQRFGRTAPGSLIDASGRPSERLSGMLADAGLSFDELTADARRFLSTAEPGMAQEWVTRATRFGQESIPFTRGDMTQLYRDQASEQRLMGMALDPDAARLREFKANQSQQFQRRVEEIANQWGEGSEAGNSVKQALINRDRMLFEEKQALYKTAFEQAPQLADVKIIPDVLLNAMPSPDEYRRISRVMDERPANALESLLTEFGVVRGEVPEGLPGLNLGNAEEFRQALLQIQRADKSGAASVVIRPMIEALDTELDTIAENLPLQRAGGELGKEVLDNLKKARAVVRKRKTEFSPDTLTGRLIGKKNDQVTPLIEGSRVINQLRSQPVEQFQRTLQSLYTAGADGKQAINNIKAAVTLEALEEALKAPSRKDAGIELVGGNQFAKYLEKRFGNDRLKVLFARDEQGLKRIQNMMQIAKDMTPSAAATPKGSATVNMDMLNSVINAPGLAIALRRGRDLLMTGESARATGRAMDTNTPDIRQLQAFQEAYPTVGVALGVPSILEFAGMPSEREQ
jgi:hypothetical protein